MFVCTECGGSAASAGPCPNDGHALRDAGDDPLLGTQIGPYRVARLIGLGGMGRVYKCVHPQIGSRVAIKVLSRECTDRPDLVERFFAEAKAVNVVSHENIVNVLDLATLPDGRPYIVMEYLDGAPLSAIIEHARSVGPLPLGAIARLAAEVLDALGAAHAKGIIHRDLKPDNIFVSPAGRAKVLDFGIAKLQPGLGAGSATHTGSLLGTPHYMAPEQAAGKPVDARADLYAIGVILFECTTLQRPFTADALFDLLRKHIEAPPPRPRALRTDLSPEFEAVILQALAKSPDERFGNANAMSFALQQATASLPPEAWAPLQPEGAIASMWTTTPPASWARSSSKAPPHSRTTPSTTPPERTRGKGLWFGIAAVILAGGGIAAIALSSGSKPAQVSATDRSGSAAPAPGPPPKPEFAPVAAAPDNLDEVDDADFDATADLAGASLEAVPLDSLPPGLRAAIKKYGSWAKVPVAVKKKLTAELVSFAAQGALGAEDPEVPAPPKPKQPPKPAPTAAPSKPELTSQPPGHDPKRANLATVLPWALAQARAFRSDAALARFDIDGVYPDGHIDLTQPTAHAAHGSLDLRFVSASHMTRGEHFYEECEFRIELEPESNEMRPMSEVTCDPAMPMPHCTLAQVWKLALAKHPDLGNVPANIIYYMANIKPHPIWSFDVKGAGVSLQFPDSCGS